MKDGIIIINKPNGITSHDVVKKVRQKFSMKRVGHAGTLDPLATGVLVVLLGKATKLFNTFVGLDKAYRATFILGTTTTSADTEGSIIEQRPYEHISVSDIEATCQNFVGEMEQTPPMVSAVKVGGKKLYELARRGIEIERAARKIKIHNLKILSIDLPKVEIYVECSKGTYIRQLAADIGESLGCGACICQIERTQVGAYILDQAVRLEELNESHIQSYSIQA